MGVINSILGSTWGLPAALMAKAAELLPEVQLQDHQQRIADRISADDPRLLVYHGLGSGKSLSALAAAEMAHRNSDSQYGIVVPASLRGNFEKEIKKFTRNSNPEIMSYTGLALGKKFQQPPETVIMDEAHRLRNPGSASSAGAAQAAAQAKRLMLLTGSPITNSPTDLANLLSMLHNKSITPEEFERRYIDYKTVRPGLFGWLRGVKPGVKPVVKNEKELRSLLRGKVDYQPSKTPDGVNVNEEVVRVPLSPEQQKIQKAIRTKIPPGFLWKLDQEFPLSKDELAKLNSFLTGLRQVSLSTQPFRADKDPAKAFTQSAKLQAAFQNLQKTLAEDKRKKAIIYSNFIDSGLAPYAAGLEKAKIPHAFFHGGVSPKARQAAVDAYNTGKLRALLIGPAGAEGLSTKGTSLIQLLDPHWHESRSQQARGRGLRFDSHRDLPEELKNVKVQRYLSASQDPSFLGKLMGYQRERTGDEVLEHLTADKEQLNEIFRKILKEEGDRYRQQREQEKQSAELPAFQPDYTPGQLHALGVYKSLYEKEGPRLASLGEWKPEWVTEHDPKGWLEWYQNYNSGRRLPDEDARQIKRWASFKARHGGPFMKDPTPRRGWALRHWAINPEKLVSRERAGEVKTMLQAYQEQELKKYLKRRRNELTQADAAPLSKQARRRLKYPKPVEHTIHSILDTDA
jgi:superfamily II DNA or RNA helicase